MEEVAINKEDDMRDLIPFLGDRSSVMRSMSDELDKALNSVLGKDFFPTALKKSSYPKMNVYQQEDTLHIDAYVPEVPKDKLNLKIEKGILTIEGSVDKEVKVEDTKYYCREVSKRSFSRSVIIPENTKLSEIKAEHKDGILRITVPFPGVKEKEITKIEIK